MTAFLPMWLSASPRPTVVVVFPSPAGVGLMAVTNTSLPSGRSASDSTKGKASLALWCPYGMTCSSAMPKRSCAMAEMRRMVARRAISMSLSAKVVSLRQRQGALILQLLPRP